MLICPKCDFENPNSHKFCQKCGMSLTHKSCLECGTSVLASDLNCHNCGAITGQIWLAIIDRQDKPESLDGEAVEIQEVEESAEVAAMPPVEMAVPSVSVESTDPPIAEESTPVGETETEEELPEAIASLTEVLEQVRASTQMPEAMEVEASRAASEGVTDSEPEEETPTRPLEPVLTETDLESPDSRILESVSPEALPFEVEAPSAEPEEILPAGSYLDPEERYQLLDDLPLNPPMPGKIQVKVLDSIPLQQSPLFALSSHPVEMPDRIDHPTPAWAMAIPAIAKAYLALHSQFYSMVPAIHDAWHWGDRQVILLEDRSTQPSLIEYIQAHPILPSQLVHWFQEVAELWIALEPWNCRQSLLETHNLCLDVEDQILCLQRLYPDLPPAVPTLKAMGEFWQTLLNSAPLTPESEGEEIEELQGILAELAAGELETEDLLRSRLEILNAKLQPEIIMSSTSPLNPLYFVDNSDHLETDDSPTMVMPVILESLEASGYTDIGRQRTHNEDDFGIETQVKQRQGAKAFSKEHKGLYILCDGMGGHEGGEIASALAVEKLREYFHRHWQENLPSEEVISTGVLFANQAIYERNEEEQRGGSGRMGTTLVLVLVQDHNAVVAHVGDSRLYRFNRSQGLQQVTLDHEVGQREIQRGVDPETAYLRPDAYQLTQALGPRNEDFVSPDVQFFKIEEDTLLILASDGLTDNDLLETHYSSHVEPLLNAEMPLGQGVKALIDLGNQFNGHDNITAIAVRALIRER
jgi:protein phosphatase